MEIFYLYLIGLSPLVLSGLYFLLRRFFPSDAFKRWFITGMAIGGLLLFAAAIYFITPAMMAESQGKGGFKPGVGNLNLIGVPFGENRIGNFFAWFDASLVYPSAFLLLLSAIYPSKSLKKLTLYALAPMSLALFGAMPLYQYALLGTISLSWKAILQTLALGYLVALSCVLVFEIIKEKSEEKLSWKDVLFCVLAFLFVYLSSLPINTMSTLIDSNQTILGGRGNVWRVYDFSLIHRLWLYGAILFPVFVYFCFRGREEKERRVVLLGICFGVLSVFTASYGFDDMFSISANGEVMVHVTSLPLHLCHTALYVVPLCLAFKWKRLFYFTYFINVFGALMAMLFPNVGENANIFSPDIALFWYNHIAAFSTPLLAVALGLFPRPKMKQMLYSLLFFGLYMLLIVFANAFLSNFVSRYDVDVPGSGTDYLFINGTYILDILSDSAYHMLDMNLTWTWGDYVMRIYPLYQSLFFAIYVAIAFAMWFVYSLFYRIADSHKDLNAALVVARKQGVSRKEKKEMKEEAVDKENIKASLKFIDFSKKYGRSARFSASHVTFDVHAGEIFGFLGPNGAGKSTCIKTSIGIQTVSEGKIEVCGFDIMKEPVKAKKLIGYVPDHYALYEMLTGREYLNYIADLYGVSKEDRDRRISKYTDLFELNDALDNQMATYSHGMKQKMTIMAALVHDPKVWILDEPLTGLDPQSIYQVKLCMKEHAKRGNIVFFSSHIINVVEKLCDRIAILRKGELVYYGTLDEVMKNHPEGLEEFYMETIRETGEDR